jgi:hypothetical protein
MGEMAANLILSEPGPEAGSASVPGQERPRVIPVPGEVILRDSTLPHSPA